ncbi:MAG: hypothetical protein J0G29_02955 [Alphaproteobacteria bacterium]|nr:hypothetical protein [Alphaproteobacteria bacterium]OJV45484.1 MAG: hypothetical protein BGO28_05155 [Alphaproteobacteria bacterium 43-37]
MTQLLTPKAVANQYSISLSTLYKQRTLNTGIPYTKDADGNTYYNRKDVEAWLANHWNPRVNKKARTYINPDVVHFVTPKYIAKTYNLCEQTLARLRQLGKGMRFVSLRGQDYYIKEQWETFYRGRNVNVNWN